MYREISIVHHLQQSVTEHFGKHISTATDCVDLANVLSQKLNVKISPQTLRRFFGLVKADSAPSTYTLDLLSKYCGFKDYKDFSQSYSKSELEIFFADTQHQDENYWQKSEQLCRQITSSAQLLVTTHRRLMPLPMARKYFLENHPMRDMIGSVYSQYFSAYLKYNKSNEAKIFAYGFLFQSAFLLENKELMELYFKKIQNTEITDHIYIIPAALKYGVQLLYADFIGNENLFRKYFSEMKKVRLQYVEASETSVFSFEYTVLESLIFTNRTKEILFLIENNTPQKNCEDAYIPLERKKTHEEVWNILCAVAYQKMGNEAKTEYYLNRVDLSNLGIGWEKYYSMMYYFVQVKRLEKHEQTTVISKLRILIDDTYFSYYETMLNGYLKNPEDQTWKSSENSPQFP